MDMEESDAELVLRVRRGNRHAAGRLLERYLRACRAVALAVTGTEPDAEDVCQEAFVVAIERIDECREPERFAGWLLQIVRNRARNHVRRESVRHTLSLDPGAPGREVSPAESAEREELRRHLLAALARLPESHREVVLLHDLEGWTHREIAERLALPAGTVRSHLHHARRLMRGLLGGHARGPEPPSP
jgi:RNA polymerase sigma-70 factor, ECF subfamily